jgi:hypothetical protein
MWTTADTTTVGDVSTRAVAAEELGDRIMTGYRDLFGLDVVHGQPARQHVDKAGVGDGAADREWLHSRSPRASLTRRGTVSTHIGMLEAYVERDGDRLRDVMLVGDFIANAAAVDILEAQLRGVPMDGAAIAATVLGVFAQPENFMLGLANLSQIADAIREAQ